VEKNLDEQSHWLLKTKVQFLLSNAAFSIISSIIVLMVFSYSQAELVFSDLKYISWIIFGVLLAFVRLIHLHQFHQKTENIDYVFWLNSYRILTFLSGLLYTALVYLFFVKVAPTFQVIIMFIVVGVTSAAVATHGVDKLTFRLFSVTIIVSTMLVLFFQPESDYKVMSGLMILFLLVVERASDQTCSTMKMNFELTYSMKYRATHDPLVGLFNRSEFEQQFEQMVATTNHGLAMMFIDLDNFKSLNDTHGHEAGDDALITAANTIRTYIRNDDVAARLGGDEFVVLLALDDISIAQRIANEICTDIARQINSQDEVQKVTSSIGLVFKADKNIGFSRLLREADIACYDSKSQGKNQVTTRIVE
jgi:diguanylate cyclase (GGDEF)-like protein